MSLQRDAVSMAPGSFCRLIAEGEKMKLSLAALVALALANVSGEASAQVVEARLDGWLCRFFNAPDASLLACERWPRPRRPGGLCFF